MVAEICKAKSKIYIETAKLLFEFKMMKSYQLWVYF